jgi:catechol 2,3-dioxygenase-like lactoylglutathione lyase family enzyme
MPISPIEGVTVVVGVTGMDEALAFYRQFFGRAPDFVLAEDFQEYEVVAGMWYQLTTRVAPGRGRRVRFGVSDIWAERQALISQGLEVTEIAGEPGIVAWCEFKDPFGNPLGYFQDLEVHPERAQSAND